MDSEKGPTGLLTAKGHNGASSVRRCNRGWRVLGEKKRRRSETAAKSAASNV